MKLKIWNPESSWEEAEAEWEQGAAEAKKRSPVKELKKLPKMQGITKGAARFLKAKAARYMLLHDSEGKIRNGFWKHPLKYGPRLFFSLLKRRPYRRDGDFFLYGVKSAEAFAEQLEDKEALFVVGFSYCHKPFECPSGRFSDRCIHDPGHPVCRQCFIGKAMHALPEERTEALVIPTIHYIGEKIFEIVHANPGKKVLFLITACEMTLEMFGDWGNMVGIQGIGVRLDGRICNTMEAFELSEKGVKPGMTVVLDETKERILNLIRRHRGSDKPS